jgi:HRDC domain
VNTNSLKAKDLVAYALIAVGVVALLGRLSGGAGWLWVGLVAIGFLWAWVAQKSYGFLVTGCILAGVAVGILLESSWGWNGAFLISLGIGFIMIDRLETRQNKWPFYVGIVLAVLGLLIGILETGFLGSFWFALILIGAGVFILTRSQGSNTGGSDNSAGWVKVEPQPTPSSPSYSASAGATVTTSTTSDTSAPSEVTSSFTSDTGNSSAAQSSVTTTPMPSAPMVTPNTTIISNTTLPFEYDQELYTKLETWRRETAKAEDRAAYLILTNDTMQQIATVKPQTTQELLDIKGIGEVKLERYGEALLKLIKG